MIDLRLSLLLIAGMALGACAGDAAPRVPQATAPPSKATAVSRPPATATSGPALAPPAPTATSALAIPTATPEPAPPPPPPAPPADPPPAAAVPAYPCEAGDCDCGDFPTHAEAQRVFVKHGGSPANNWSRLDANHDGVACETLP